MALSQKDSMVPFNVSRAMVFVLLVACSVVECTILVSTGTVNYQVIKYYVHDDLLQRANNSAFVIAAPGGDLSTIQQGALVAVNDLITEGPEVDSRKLGNAQGVYLVRARAQQLPHPPTIHGRVQGQVQWDDLLPMRRRRVAPGARDRGRGRNRGISECIRVLFNHDREANRHVVVLARVRDPSLHSRAKKYRNLVERYRREN